MILIYIGLLIVRHILNSRVRKWVDKTKGNVDNFVLDLVSNTKNWFLLLVSIAIGIIFLNILPDWNQKIRIVLVIGFTLQISSWAVATVSYFINSKMKVEKNSSKVTIYNTVGIVARILVWVFAGLIILDSFPNVDISSLVAGLGIGGIAIGFAVQSILEDLFASVSITVDQPFVLGDFIVVGDISGTVEKIGMKTTRIRSLSGEQIVIGNAAITSDKIQNYQKLQERRVTITVGVTYETPIEKLRMIPEIIEGIAKEQKNVRFDRVHLDEMADFSINYLLVYYALTADYTEHMDIKEAINFGILEKFAENKIDIAYPTQMLYVSKNE
jgi:small-conductance mechanosensitive channel